MTQAILPKKDYQWAIMVMYRHCDVQVGRKIDGCGHTFRNFCFPLTAKTLPVNIWFEQITRGSSVPRYWWCCHWRAFWTAVANPFSATGQALLQRTAYFGLLFVSQNAAKIAQWYADKTWCGTPRPVSLLHRMATGTLVQCAFPPSQTAILAFCVLNIFVSI